MQSVTPKNAHWQLPPETQLFEARQQSVKACLCGVWMQIIRIYFYYIRTKKLNFNKIKIEKILITSSTKSNFLYRSNKINLVLFLEKYLLHIRSQYPYEYKMSHHYLSLRILFILLYFKLEFIGFISISIIYDLLINSYFMLAKQLQEIALECTSLLKAIEINTLQEDPLQIIEVMIRKRITEIDQLRRDIRNMQIEQTKKKKLNIYIKAIKKQITNMQGLNYKERTHSIQLEKFCQKLRLKLSDQQSKTNNLNQEELILKEFQIYVDQNLENEYQYSLLKDKYDELSKQIRQLRLENEKIVQSKRLWINEMIKNNESVDIKIKYITNQICIQEGIINQINHVQTSGKNFSINNNEQDTFSILNKQQQVFFEKDRDLTFWEKLQIQNLLQNKSIEKQKQTRRIGSIFKQRFTLHNEGNNHINTRLNLSADLSKLSQKLQTKKSLTHNEFHFVSNDRIKALQKNKRIRTRYTEPLSPKQKYKTILKSVIHEQRQQQAQKSSIISIYEKFRKDRIDNNPSVIKIKRQDNKRKYFPANKGVPIQSQPWN